MFSIQILNLIQYHFAIRENISGKEYGVRKLLSGSGCGYRAPYHSTASLISGKAEKPT